MILALQAILFDIVPVPLLGLSDIVLILLLVVNIRNIQLKFQSLIIPLSILLLFSLNCYISLFSSTSIKIEGLAFFYKWMTPFIILLLLDNFYKSEHQLDLLHKNLLIFTCALSIWTILYTPLLLSGHIVGNFRPSYPFADDFHVSDAHVLSSSLGILFMTIYFLKKTSFKLLVLITTLIALLMTGSRTGILLLVIMFGANTIRTLFLLVHTKKVSPKLVFATVCILLITIIGLQFNLVDIDISNIVKTATRSININFSDESADGRTQKLLLALSEFEDNVLFGRGFLTAALTWYDGLFSIIIVHGGIILLTIFSLYILFVFSQHRKNWAFFVTFSCFIVSNLITEHLLITRYILPVMICLWLLSKMEREFSAP